MIDFGSVAVLYGGWSEERSVSLDSGAAVHAALEAAGVNATLVDATPERVLGLRQAGFDRVFNALHGRGGEDGLVQAALELQGLSFTGSGVAASALAMDKWRSKCLWQACGLPTPECHLAGDEVSAQAAADHLGYPVFIKPAREGSSVGLSKVKQRAEVAAAYAKARAVDSEVLVERGISGGEFTVGMLGDQALPMLQIIPPGEYYDFEAKYQSDHTQYLLVDEHPQTSVDAVQQLCSQAFKVLGCRGWGRVDCMIDHAGQTWLLEANTIPGMTSHSLVPKAAAAMGVEFEELVLRILEQTLEARS